LSSLLAAAPIKKRSQYRELGDEVYVETKLSPGFGSHDIFYNILNFILIYHVNLKCQSENSRISMVIFENGTGEPIKIN